MANAPHLAQSDIDIDSCFDVMLQLRPDLNRNAFVQQVKRQRKQGYDVAFIKDGSKVVCVAGFRLSESLSWCKFMYVDDLITDAGERSKGYGDTLLDWLVEYAKSQGCQELHLDSGVQRFDAHRFYLRKRMIISAHHFTLKLG